MVEIGRMAQKLERLVETHGVAHRHHSRCVYQSLTVKNMFSIMATVEVKTISEYKISTCSFLSLYRCASAFIFSCKSCLDLSMASC